MGGAPSNKPSQRGVLFGYSQRLYIVELPQICSSIEERLTARLGESGIVALPRKYLQHNKKSAPWGIEDVVTRLEPLRVLRTPRKRYNSTPRPAGSIATR